jgi:hypothetical protein
MSDYFHHKEGTQHHPSQQEHVAHHQGETISRVSTCSRRCLMHAERLELRQAESYQVDGQEQCKTKKKTIDWYFDDCSSVRRFYAGIVLLFLCSLFRKAGATFACWSPPS